MGLDAIKPFLQNNNKGAAILSRTSNPGNQDFQTLRINGTPLYEEVIDSLLKRWPQANNILFVVGANHLQSLKIIRQKSEELTLLVPSVGAQGGDVSKVIKAGANKQGKGLIINVGRAVIYAQEPRLALKQLLTT